jgi:hypothetical protein
VKRLGSSATLPGRAFRRAQQAISFHTWDDQWFIALGRSSGERPDTCRFDRFERLMPPWDRFWADPFPVEADGAWHVFFEDFSYEHDRGRIAVVTVTVDGAISGPRTVLERPYHLSYPFVFEWGGAHFMVPESRSSGQIELYRADAFPAGWSRVGTLLDGVWAADATLVDWDGLWWMFVNLSHDGRLENDRLHLFSATEPFGPWVEHRQSPLTLNSTAIRPAGRLFRHDSGLYRPSQSGVARYGHHLQVNRVIRLDPHEYAEEVVGVVMPTWHPRLRGTHTLNRAGEIVCVDGYVRRLRPPRRLAWSARGVYRRARALGGRLTERSGQAMRRWSGRGRR